MTNDELRKLAEDLADLDGPWGLSQSSLIGGYSTVICEQIVVAHCFREEAAALIAAASPDVVLGLLDEITRLQNLCITIGGERDEARGCVDMLVGELDEIAHGSVSDLEGAAEAARDAMNDPVIQRILEGVEDAGEHL